MLQDRIHFSVVERRAPRERALLAARLNWEGSAFGVEAMVTQLSSTGARIAVDGFPTLPSELTVEVPRRAIARRASIVWQEEGELAVKFEPDVASEEKSPEEKIRRLNEMIAALRTQNERLRAELFRLRGG